MSGTRKTFNRICFASIDVELDVGEKDKYQGVEKLGSLLGVFQENNVPLTCFVTGDALRKYGSQVEEWGKEYEIGCHGFSHRFWNNLDNKEKERELNLFLDVYRNHFGEPPFGFRAPSHVLSSEGLNLLEEKGFLYDSSIVPHYPPLKKYRGYNGPAPLSPYFPERELIRKKGDMKILEIPVTGLSLGIPLAGTWVSKLPLSMYRVLMVLSSPVFLTLNLHSWDSLNKSLYPKIDEILKILKNKGYKFLTGFQVYELFSENRR
ncbi:MAG: polysaccharide deacetylase family protein [Candidatus Nealsonbacteria bacterium]|nr:polysaccharide deacetylase family protein [Candidatus Nealsonbacteria bacterium]